MMPAFSWLQRARVHAQSHSTHARALSTTTDNTLKSLRPLAAAPFTHMASAVSAMVLLASLVLSSLFLVLLIAEQVRG